MSSLNANAKPGLNTTVFFFSFQYHFVALTQDLVRPLSSQYFRAAQTPNFKMTRALSIFYGRLESEILSSSQNSFMPTHSNRFCRRIGTWVTLSCLCLHRNPKHEENLNPFLATPSVTLLCTHLNLQQQDCLTFLSSRH